METIAKEKNITNKNSKRKGSLKVYKANKLIEARYDLTLNEQKLTLYAASRVDCFIGDNFNILRIPVADFFKKAGLDENSKNHTYIKELALGLMKKQLYIESEDGNWEAFQWVNRTKYIQNSGIIEFEFSPVLKPFLLKLDGYYKGYPLKEVLQLTSKYSIRLYELLIQHEFTWHKSLTIEVEELRKKMGLTNEYERFTNFETNVIKIAVNELNSKSNIKVDYEKIKKGRKIHEIKFTFLISKKERDLQLEELLKLKEEGLADHINIIREALNVNNDLVFDDLHIDEAYMTTFNKLSIFEYAVKDLVNAICSYMKYYYDYTIHYANNRSFNYFHQALAQDYHNLTERLKLGERYEDIKYIKD